VAKPSFRVYFTTHFDGRKTGVLLRTWDALFDRPAPSAYGATEDDVFRQLELTLRELEVTGEDHLLRYLWEETFQSQEVLVDVHPLSIVKKRTVIGKKKVPLRLTYIHSKLPSGAFRVMMPRLGGWYILEDLSLAPEVLRQAVSTMLLGENPRWIYEFRHDGDEYVREWEPRFLQRMDELALTRSAPAPASALARVAEDLVDKALRHKLPPTLGDDDDLRPLLPLLQQRPPASLLLVGGPGVGKSTWVRRMARLLAGERRADAPGPALWSTTADRIIAGMIYLGMWQERCLQIAEELGQRGDYLHVDRLVPLLHPQPDGSSIAELFLPALQAGEMGLIAECTEAEFERCQRRFPALLSLFRVVRLAETPASVMLGMLDRYQHRKEQGARLSTPGLKRLVQHLATFQPSHCFPGKGFRFVDWLYQESPAPRARALSAREVSEAYARYSGLPVELIADDIPAGAEVHAAALRRQVIGQDEACGVAARVLARFKAGLNDPERPCGTMLFVGPTGVGKTELAKQLTRYMFGEEGRMIRLDMSEFMAPGAAARMMEVGRGVSSLAQRVREQPLSLILLDEIEKAHPEVFDLLLGILGEGRLSDAFGRLVDFRMTMILMTSNLGAGARGPVGFGDERSDGSFLKAVRQHFRPEFFNRIDHVISFHGLSPADLLRIVDLELERANQRTGLLRRNLRLRVTAEAREFLARIGYHPTLGARPLKRVIEERLITPLAARMAQDAQFRDREILVLPGGTGGPLAPDTLVL
jgi:ATP-dependent Clp protease ATP-binding subunit ClpC